MYLDQIFLPFSDIILDSMSSIKDEASLLPITLEAQLLLIRRHVASLVHAGQPAAATLHPLYLSENDNARVRTDKAIEQVRSSLSHASTTLTEASTSQSQAEQAHLASLLREKSVHTHALCDVINHAESGLAAPTHFLSPSLMIGAVVDPKQWPTRDEAQATAGMDALEQSFESIAKEMGLEAFAEKGQGTSEAQVKYTLTLAARILVIDADFQQADVEGIWTPTLAVRVSYATDNASPRSSSQLANVLQTDMQAIANAVFGFEQNALEAAERHLRRLRSTVRVLKGLDDLSSSVQVSGHVDLFAFMEDFCVRLRQHSVAVEHVARPYATVALQPLSSDSSLSDFASNVRIAHFSVERSSQYQVQKEDDEELPIDTEKGQVRFVAMFDPPMPMQKWMLARLLQAAGVHVAKNSEVIRFADHVAESTTLQQLLGHSTGQDAVDVHEQALLVNRLPFSSVRRLIEALNILKEQERINTYVKAFVDRGWVVSTRGEVEKQTTLVTFEEHKDASLLTGKLAVQQKDQLEATVSRQEESVTLPADVAASFLEQSADRLAELINEWASNALGGKREANEADANNEKRQRRS